MGDRCYLSLKTNEDGARAFEAIFEVGAISCGDGTFEVVIEEANYAEYDALRQAASDGAIFYGSHTSGCEYGPAVFASDGESCQWRDVGHDGQLIVNCDKEGYVDEYDADQARIFWLFEKQVMEQVGD